MVRENDWRSEMLLDGWDSLVLSQNCIEEALVLRFSMVKLCLAESV